MLTRRDTIVELDGLQYRIVDRIGSFGQPHWNLKQIHSLTYREKG